MKNKKETKQSLIKEAVLKKKNSGVPVAIAILLLVGSATYIYAKTVSNSRYTRKWQDYDDCGI